MSSERQITPFFGTRWQKFLASTFVMIWVTGILDAMGLPEPIVLSSGTSTLLLAIATLFNAACSATE